jgi:uncharacterized repeat protein (TIGR01451 family)
MTAHLSLARTTALLLLLCLIVGGLFLIPEQGLAQGSNRATLTLADDLVSAPGRIVAVPMTLSGSGGVSGISMSIDYDQSCLRFYPQDSSGNGIPDSVFFNVPPAFRVSFSYDMQDEDGELDIIIADYSPPFAVLPQAVLMIVEFEVICQPEPGQIRTTPVKFSLDPPVTFSDGNGQPIPGQGIDGLVTILDDPGGLANRPPIAHNDWAEVDEDSSVLIPVLENDRELDGEPLSLVEVGRPAFGTATLVRTPGQLDQIRYRPNPNFFGSDSFRYVVADSQGNTDDAVVTVTVNPVDDPPIAVDDRVETDEDVPVLIYPLANDIELDGQPLFLLDFGQPEWGSVTRVGTDGLRFEPALDRWGTVVFTYTVGDAPAGFGLTDVGRITVVVRPVNDPPIANRDAVSMAPGQSKLIPVLENDLDPEGDPLTLVAVGPTSLPGSRAELAGEQIRYSAGVSVTGRDTFTYTISDGELTAQGLVIVDVAQPAARLTVLSTPAPGTAVALGQVISYTVRYENVGEIDLRDVLLEVALSPNLALLSAQNGRLGHEEIHPRQGEPIRLNWRMSNLPPGQALIVHLRAEVRTEDLDAATLSAWGQSGETGEEAHDPVVHPLTLTGAGGETNLLFIFLPILAGNGPGGASQPYQIHLPILVGGGVSGTAQPYQIFIPTLLGGGVSGMAQPHQIFIPTLLRLRE